MNSKNIQKREYFQRLCHCGNFYFFQNSNCVEPGSKSGSGIQFRGGTGSRNFPKTYHFNITGLRCGKVKFFKIKKILLVRNCGSSSSLLPLPFPKFLAKKLVKCVSKTIDLKFWIKNRSQLILQVKIINTLSNKMRDRNGPT